MTDLPTDVVAHLRLDRSMLLSVRADPATYARLIDALLDGGHAIEGTTEAQMVLDVAEMEARDGRPPETAP